MSLGLEQGNAFNFDTIRIFNSGNIEFLNYDATTVFQTISIQNANPINQWNILQNYRFAVNLSTTAFSIRIYDYQPTGTNFQYYGIFSNNNVGDQTSPTCPFQIRNDGYIELKANYTNTPTTSNGGISLMGVSNMYHAQGIRHIMSSNKLVYQLVMLGRVGLLLNLEDSIFLGSPIVQEQLG